MAKSKPEESNELTTDDFDPSKFEFEQVTEHDVIRTEKEPSNAPEYGSKEWSAYVMSMFDPSELMDGNPVCSGLRRVAELLLGDIVSSGPCEVYPATDTNGPGRATVVFEVIFNWHNDGELRKFKEVADAWHGNTDDLFSAYPVATASTRAEGRALRKALKVKCLAAEELTKNKDVEAIVRQSLGTKTTNGEISLTPSDKITKAQINFVDTLSKRLDIDAMKHLNSTGGNYKSPLDITKKDAIDLLALLNKYQNGEAVCPPEIKGYDPNWRKQYEA